MYVHLEGSFSHLVYCCLKQLCFILLKEHTGQDSEGNSSFLHEQFSSRSCGGCPSIQQHWCLGLIELLKEFFQSSPFAVPWLAKHSGFGGHRVPTWWNSFRSPPSALQPLVAIQVMAPKCNMKSGATSGPSTHYYFPQIGTTLLISAPRGLSQSFRLCCEDIECTCVCVFHKV